MSKSRAIATGAMHRRSALLFVLLLATVCIWSQDSYCYFALHKKLTDDTRLQETTTHSFGEIQCTLGQASVRSRHVEQFGREIAGLGDLLRAPRSTRSRCSGTLSARRSLMASSMEPIGLLLLLPYTSPSVTSSRAPTAFDHRLSLRRNPRNLLAQQQRSGVAR